MSVGARGGMQKILILMNKSLFFSSLLLFTIISSIKIYIYIFFSFFTVVIFLFKLFFSQYLNQ